MHDDQVPKFVERHLPYVRRLARNLDQLLIVSSFVSPPLKTGLIDRFLVLTELEEIDALICLNKTDLLEDRARPDELLKMYSALGYDVLTTSVKTGEGIGELYEKLKFKRTALAGHSGVGKSSLLNAISPDLQIHVNEVSKYSNKGKHTTTRIKIYDLDAYTEVVDLPGIKVVDFVDIHYSEARFYFREFEGLAESCKFRDCLHINEQDCAVKSAVESGGVHPLRYQSYLNFVDSLR